MAAKKETVQEQASEDVRKEKSAEKYSVEKLKEHCIDVFGVSQSTFAGAMHGHEGNYTIDEAKAILNEWLFGKEANK